MKFQLVAIVLPFLTAVMADEIHIAYCGLSSSTFDITQTQIIFYPGSPPPFEDFTAPPSSDICTISGEINLGGSISCTFSTGITTHFTLESGGGSAPVFSQIGSVTNTFEDYTCFRDDSHNLYSTFAGNGGSFLCQSEVFCLP